MLIEHSGASDSTTSAGADEVNHFSSEPLVDYKVAVPLSGGVSTRLGFLYWHKLLGVFVSGTVTSVPSERLFSQADILYEEHHNRIQPENAETSLFIKGIMPC